MARGDRSIQRRVRDLVGGRGLGIGPAVQAPVQAPVPTTLWGEMHENLGNAAVSTLVVDGPEDAAGLYLADVLAASARTGEDFRSFLPWRASAEWSRFALAWYRVLWAERERQGLAAAGEQGLDRFDGMGAVASGAAVGAASVGHAEIAPSVDALASVEGPAGAEAGLATDAVVARHARGPDITDPVAMNAWFDQLDRQSGAGRLLTPTETDFLEEVHGRPIPDARIHEGAFARDMAAQINARAFTVGRDVWMGEEVDLADPRGAELLAHEITHVIQNALGRGASSTSGPVSSPGDAHEREAEARGREAAGLVARGEWGFQAPDGLDGRGRYLSSLIQGQLPSGAPPAPVSLLQEGLRELLAARAEARISAAVAELQALGSDSAEVQAAFAQLDEARAAVAEAGADLGSLTALLGLGGRPSAGELQSLQSGFAPYPSFAAQAAAFLAALPTPEGALASAPAVAASPESDVEALFRVGNVADVDPARALHTAALVDRLAQALRLPSGTVHVRADSAAAERLAEVGTHGLFEGGEVLLDPSAYDPTTVDGRSLLAHEVTHVAQGALPAYDVPNAGLMAEAEAHLAADAFAAGAAIQPLMMGLPEGHVAAEGEISGAALNACLAAYKGDAESAKGTLTPPPGSNDSTKSSATQNRREKVRQYTDGVDGIADQIGDLDAFDDLCDSIDEAEDHEEANAEAQKAGQPTTNAPANASPNGPLARVKASQPYKDLCRMWQSAKEGGDDSGEMMAAFDNEFDDRGFWGSTEDAFDLVELNAKRDAKPEPAAEQGKQTAATAQRELNQLDPNQQDGKGGGKATNGEKNSDLNAGGVPADLQALMGSSVEDKAPDIASFETMKGVSDADFNALVGKTKEFDGFSQSVQSGPGATSRTQQIGSTLWNNLSGSFIAGFSDQMVDSLVWDNIGKLGDKALNGLTKGRLGGKGAPFIGPILGLGKEFFNAYGPNGMDWGKLASSASGFGKMGEGLSSFGQMGETLGNLNRCHSATDVIGVLFAAAADFFQGLRDLVDGLATLCGNLSALCYIVGGILILVGIATAWLGWGIGLINAGTWICRMGTILARINTALGYLAFFLSGVTLFFRTIAAFTVPAELYAKQLEGVGSAADTFGQKAGERTADKTAESIQNAVTRPKADGTADPADPGGEQRGEQTHRDADQQIDARNRQLEDLNQQAEQERTRLKEEQDAAAAERDKDKARDQDDPEATRSKESVGRRVLKVLDTATKMSDTWDALKDLGTVVKEGPNSGKNGHVVDPERRGNVIKAAEHGIQRQQKKIDDLRRELEKARSEPLRQEDAAAIQKKIDERVSELEGKKADIERLKADFERAKQLEDAIAEEERVKEKNEKKKPGDPDEESPIAREIASKKQKVSDLDAEVKKLQSDYDKAKEEGDRKVDTLQGDLDRAKAEADRLRSEVGDADAARNEIADHDQRFREEQTRKANDVDARMKNLRTEADALDKQAGDAEKARTLRAEATKAEAQVAKTQKNVNAALNSLDQHVGKTVVLKGGTNGRSTRDANLRGVTADGLVVSDGKGGTRTVPFSDVFGPQGVRAAAVRADTESQKLKDLQATVDEGRRADTLAPADADPQRLRDEASAKRVEAENLQPEWEAARSATPPTHPKQTKLDQTQTLDGRAADLQRQIDGVKENVRDKETRLGEAKKNLGTAEQDVRDAETKQKAMERMADANSYLREASSGNATGGVGSSFKFYGEAIFRIVDSFDKLLATWKETGVTARSIALVVKEPDAKEGDDRTKSLGEKLVSKLPFIQKQSEQQLQQIGKKQEAIERVLALPPPVDMKAMEEKRKKAGETWLKYQAAHTHALQAWQAEQIVEKHSVETKKLAGAGKPIEDASKSMAQPLTTSKNDESQRSSIIGSQDPNAPKQESGAGGIVMQLVQKLASHSDGMEEQPSANGGSGNNIEEGQEKGKKDTKDNHDRAKRLSEQQRMFLDEAIATRTGQEQYVCSNIQSLEEKYTEEQAIKQEIQLIKAQALQEREAHRAVIEENASGFNTDYEQLSAWAVDFDSRMLYVQEAGGS